MVTRVYVEKRRGFDVEAKQMQDDLAKNLHFDALSDLRLINRYDISGLALDELEAAVRTILSEPNTDEVYGEDFALPPEYLAFAVEYLPGQYDQRADSAAQCAQLLTQGERPVIVTARVIAVKGVNVSDLDAIKNYLVNPVEARIASMDKPKSLALQLPIPERTPRMIGFVHWDDKEMQSFYHSMGFAMSMEDLIFCQRYFREEEKRDPTLTELKVIDTYWSDHCRHTTFLTELTQIEVEPGALHNAVTSALESFLEKRLALYGDNKRPISLMDIATFGGKYLYRNGKIPDLDISEEINACSIEVPVSIDGRVEQWLVQFKNETHNHPTEIEPFGGAATCLGGAIRDPLSGRAYVYQAMRVTGSGDPTVPDEDTLPGKLPARKITTGAAQGYSAYGNQIGLATGQVTELYHPGYVAKRLEIGAVVGACPKANVRRETPAAGDFVLLLGGATGRDGIGGATGSSKAHTAQSVEVCGAEVQKGNPPTERKLQRLFRNPEFSKRIKRCNDFGAGGVCVAIGELAPGLTIELDAVPKKYEGLNGTELAISESQERMAIVIAPEDMSYMVALAAQENLDASHVATITKSPRLKMIWQQDCIVDISRAFLDTNGVSQKQTAFIKAPTGINYRDQVPPILTELPLYEALKTNMARLEVCGQRGLCERFDASIGAATVLMPFAGKYQLTPEEAMVAKLPLEYGETDDATAMAYGFIPNLMAYSPFLGAAYAVVESLSKLAAVGANPLSARLTFQEYFERLHQTPERWGKPTAALLGALSAQLGLEIPAIGGKDSMSGSFEDLDAPPTLVSFAIAMTKASQTLSSAFTTPGSRTILLPIPTDVDGLPDWSKLKQYYQSVFACVNNKRIIHASVVREGGAAAAVLRMCFGNKIGFSFSDNLTKELLFSPKSGAMILCLADSAPDDCLSAFQPILLGKTHAMPAVSIDGANIALDELINVWEGTLEHVFNTHRPSVTVTDIPLWTTRSSAAPAIKTARPRVVIPVFPGTNCEVDTARAFIKAGADPQICIIRNRTATDIEESIEEFERALRASQILMLPGGFSGGDEPDGSGKFIATTLRNPRIADAAADLLEQRDGLILGICNGFQALVKVGLLPKGKIVTLNPSDPTLTFNSLGRHISRMAYTRVTSVKSPWLAGVQPGEVFCVPVSHGEGRFVADEETLLRLTQNGQVATQYCMPDGTISGDIQWNPNGSLLSIESITSADGRIMGKMGHSERKGENLYQNVPGNKDQRIFESGVRYFQ